MDACFPLQARKNELAIEDMDGGTFTISNGGVFGSMFGTPIINPPQSAILGMHGIFDRPVAISGKVCTFGVVGVCRSGVGPVLNGLGVWDFTGILYTHRPLY